MDILVFLAGQRAKPSRAESHPLGVHCKCSAQAAQTLAPDKPTKHFTAYDLVAKTIKPIIDAFQHLDNRHRPNGTVGGLAPAQYLAALKAKDTSRLKGALDIPLSVGFT
jgi:hypothetical protein